VKIIKWLRLPESKDIKDLDDPATTLLHAQIIQKKPFLKNILIFTNSLKKRYLILKIKFLLNSAVAAALLKR